MSFANVLIVVFVTYYTFYFLKLFSPRKRRNIRKANRDMNNIRSKPMKTVEEQKKFLDIKYPRRGKFIWHWKIIPKILFRLLLFIFLFQFYGWLFYISNIELRLWQAILMVMILPIIINIILEKFDLEKSDLRRMLR